MTGMVLLSRGDSGTRLLVLSVRGLRSFGSLCTYEAITCPLMSFRHENVRFRLGIATSLLEAATLDMGHTIATESPGLWDEGRY